jgi:hypothetical protein
MQNVQANFFLSGSGLGCRCACAIAAHLHSEGASSDAAFGAEFTISNSGADYITIGAAWPVCRPTAAAWMQTKPVL